MQAYKLKGKIDKTGRLIVNETTAMTPGEVEVIVLKSSVPLLKKEGLADDRLPRSETKLENKTSYSKQSLKNRPSKVKAFQNWFAKTEAKLSDVNIEENKWQYLQEKYEL